MPIAVRQRGYAGVHGKNLLSFVAPDKRALLVSRVSLSWLAVGMLSFFLRAVASACHFSLGVKSVEHFPRVPSIVGCCMLSRPERTHEVPQRTRVSKHFLFSSSSKTALLIASHHLHSASTVRGCAIYCHHASNPLHSRTSKRRKLLEMATFGASLCHCQICTSCNGLTCCILRL